MPDSPAVAPPPVAPTSKRELGAQRRMLFWLLLCGAALRIAWTLAFPVERFHSDPARYHERALELLNHGAFGYPNPTAFEPPAYPAFLAGIYWLFGSGNAFAVALVQIALNLATLLLFADLVRRQAGGRMALWCLAVLMVHPTMVTLPNVYLSETLAFFLFMGACWIWLTRKANAWGWNLLSGLLLGLAALTRELFFFFAPMLLLAEFTLRRQWMGVSWRSWARIVAVVCLVVAPWSVRNYVALGIVAPISTNSSVNLYFGHNPIRAGYVPVIPHADRTEAEQYRLLREEAVGYMVRHPVQTVLRLPLKAAGLFDWLPYGLVWNGFQTRVTSAPGYAVLFWAYAVWNVLLVVGGLGACVRHADLRRQPISRVGLALMVLMLAIHCVTFSEPRFRFPLEVFLVYWGCCFALRMGGAKRACNAAEGRG